MSDSPQQCCVESRIDMRNTSPDFLAGGGEMGELIRAKDWSKTPLGPPDNWPQSLKTIVRIMLTSRQPIWIGWGPEMIKLYNDPYKAIVGGKHPEALGQPVSVVWHEIWNDIEPRLNTALRENVGTYDESLLLIMERYGYPEETYYTFSYSPVPGDQGGVEGIICANSDDTQKIIGERQLSLLSKMAAETRDARTIEKVCTLSAKSLEQNQHDIPFAMIYLLDQDTQSMYLAGTTGIQPNHLAVPANLALHDRALWPVEDVLKHQHLYVISDLADKFTDLPMGAWKIPPRQAAIVPIAPSGETGKAGVLIVGLSPLRVFDEGYQGFINLVAGQIAAGIANAQAYEEERKRAEALAEIDRAKTLFFSNVSHEFRTPLTLMLGPIEDALRDQDTIEKNRERMDIAHRNAIRLLKLVNSLLDFSRIEAGRIQAVYEPTNLSLYTSDLASSFRSAIEKAGIRFTIHTPQLSEAIYVDRDMWEKIVLNLLSNAFKFTFQGEIAVTLKEYKEQVVLSVSDTGTGIPAQHLHRIFERFHRVEGAKSRSFEGSGIGLSLVQELVKFHQGTIDVQSVEGKGTTFTVALPKGFAHLPKERIDAQRTQQSTALGANSFIEEVMHWLPSDKQATNIVAAEIGTISGFAEKPRIVLVDDNADMRDYVTRLLQTRFTVEAYPNGALALQGIQKQAPDLVLSDIMMPEMDGFQLLKALKENTSTSRIPVILLSARAGEEATLEGVKAGADDYLVKPFSARELLARVTTHIKTARSRYETEQRLYNLFMQAPAAVVILQGNEHRITLANPTTLKLWGRTSEDVLYKPIFEALPEIRGQGLEQLLLDVYMTGEPFFGKEIKVALDRNASGSLEDVYFTFVYTPLRDTNDRIEGVMVFAYDVTDHVLSRRRIAESETRFRTLADNIPNLVWMARPDGWVYWYNSRWYEYTGATKEQMEGRGWQSAIDPQELPTVVERWQHSLNTGEALEIVLSLKDVHGEFHPYLTRVVPIYDVSGEHIVQWFGTCTDITKQKQLEQQKDDFIGVASHELKTPVTSIKAYTQLLARRFQKASDVRSVELVKKMDGQLNRLTGLIADLLDVTRIESGKLQFHETEFQFDELVKEIVEETQRTANNHHIRCELSSGMNTRGDRDRIGQVLTNLLINAIKYSPRSDVIIVKTNHYNGSVVASVQDFGIGIPQEKQERVFDRFFRVDGEKQETYPGLGLGLYISSEIVKRHRGRIWLESQVGQGSTFTFALPESQSNASGAMEIS